jgi:hypothetical protein
MAIIVGHGGGFGNAGALIASAIGREQQRGHERAMQAQELANRGAIASAQAQMQYEASRESNQTALAQTAIKAGLQQDMQMQEYLQGLESAREQARTDAAKFDQKFTAEQRVKDARLQQARKAIEQSQDMTPQQKQEALRRLDIEIATNSNPTQVLGDANAQPAKDGRTPGEVYVDPNTGALMSVEMDGNRRMHASYDKTEAGMRQKFEAERQKEIDKLQADAETNRQNAAIEAQKTKATTRQKMISDMISANMKAEEGARLTPEQIVSQIQKMEAIQEKLELAEQGGARDPNQELIEAAKKSGGTVSFRTPSGEMRSYTFKGDAARQAETGARQGDESLQWLENARRQYPGGIREMPVEMRRQAQIHARRAKASRRGR